MIYATIPLLPLYFCFFVLFVVANYFVGVIIGRFFSIGNGFRIQPIVLNSLMGYIFLVVVFSIVRTQFVTVNIVYLFLFAMAGYEVYRNRPLITQRQASSVRIGAAPIVLLLLMVFLWRWFSISNTDSFLHFNFFQDDIIYSRISRSIDQTGIENVFFFLTDFDSYYQVPEPYHYFDLWGGAIVARIFNVNHYLGLHLIIYPFFYFLAAIGFLQLFEKRSSVFAIAAFLFLFFTGMYVSQYDTIPFLSSLINFNSTIASASLTKLCYSYIFIVSAYRLYTIGLRGLSIVVLLSLSIANIIHLPVIVGSLIILLMYEYFTKRESRNETIRFLFYVCVTLLLVVSHYLIFQKRSDEFAGLGIADPIQLVLDGLRGVNFNTQRNIIVGALIQLVIFYFPLLPMIILFIKIRKADSSDSFFFWTRLTIVWVSVSLTGWAMLYRDTNASEIFLLNAIPFINCVFTIGLISISNSSSYFLKKNRLLVVASATVVVLLIGQQLVVSVLSEKMSDTNPYSNEYLHRIEETVQSGKLTQGACIRDRSLLEEIHHKDNTVYLLGNYLALIDESISVVNIGDFNTPIDSSSELSYERSQRAISNGVFYRYAQQRNSLPINSTLVANSQVSFIDEYGIQFVIASEKAEVPEKIMTEAREIIVDENTGERFIVLP